MKKFFIFFIITIIITSCVPNKKILSPEQLMQDKIQTEKIIGRWNLLIGRYLYETNFYKDNTALWQTTVHSYSTQSDELIKIKLNWKIADSKMILLATKINSNSIRPLLGQYGSCSILEFSDDRIILKGHNGKEAIMVRQ